MENNDVDVNERESARDNNGFVQVSEPSVSTSSSAEDSISYANVLRSRNKFVDALALYERVLKNDGANVEALIGKGMCLQMQNMRKLALDAFSEAIKLDPQNACALTQCGILYKEEGRLVEAAESYQKALRVDPSYKAAAEYLAIVLTDIGTNIKLAGNTQEGIQKYLEALRVDPHYAPAYYNLGVVYSEMMQYDMALSFYEKAASERPMYAEAYCNMGVIFKNRGDLEMAITCYERCLAVSPNFEIAKNNMAIALTDLGTKVKLEGDINRGLAFYKKALYYNWRYADAMYNLGVAYGEMLKFDMAIVFYELAFHFNPHCVEACNNLGVIYKDHDNLDKAVECYQLALSIKPNFSQSLNNLGVVYTVQGKIDAAANMIEKAITANPTYAEAYNNLGKFLQAKRNNLFWTPCAAHCVDLMLEDIGKIPRIKRAIQRGVTLVSFIYNHTMTLNTMRKFTNKTELVRFGVTRFATSFLTLQRLHKQKGNLRKMFTNDEWSQSKTAKEAKGKRATDTVLMPSFWNDVLYTLKAMGPLVHVLRLIDNEKKPAMGYIYEAMDRAKEAIQKAFNGNDDKYKDIFAIIDRRWEVQLHHPLHAAGHFLNPQFFYGNPNLEFDHEVIEGLHKCIERLSATEEEVDKITDELPLYRRAGGMFGIRAAIKQRSTLSPGVLYRDVGDIALAINAYEQCLKSDPDSRNAGQNRLLAMNYMDEGNDDTLFEAHRDWGRRFMRLYPQYTSWDNPKDPERPLVIGYVSPDYFTHSVSYFIEAPLVYHDYTNYKVIVYSAVVKADAKTVRFREKALNKGGIWKDIYGIDEKNVADMVREDQVDILVELTGHTANNKLGMMACRPAPIQITWIGYPNTTGLPTIDYRITDSLADPPETKQKYVEELVRLPESFLCYTPSPEAGPVCPTPALSNGFITFGSFNNLAKITPKVLQVWARILCAIPTSRLVVKCKPFCCDSVRQRFLSTLEQSGLEPLRVDLLPLINLNHDHMQAYSLMDISLDTFPYAGTTTTCESLYMGVPCVTMAGSVHAHNVGVSLLSKVGLEHLIARNEDEYVQLALQLASDISALQNLRMSLRDLMSKSPLCDGANFTLGLESTYRDVWRRYCKGDVPSLKRMELL